MPARKKPTLDESKKAVADSLREWGVQHRKGGKHAEFFDKIKYFKDTDATESGAIGAIDLPKDRDEAIHVVFVQGLLEYNDKKVYNLRANKAEDALEDLLTKNDDAASIIGRAPYDLSRAGQNRGQPRKRPPFARFRESDLDPFRRFSVRNDRLSSAELAYSDCTDEGWMDGNAFEAIVSTHAIHNQTCYRCHRRNSLVWCGGSDFSWRDIFCRSCKSCFEIKSKTNKAIVDSIFYFNSFEGGSFRRWCGESFESRTEGTDFIVFVSREPSYVNKTLVWSVEIAEIGSALPVVSKDSFATRRLEYPGVLRTAVTFKNRSKWFDVPVGESQPDVKNIFRQSFEEAFPEEWKRIILPQEGATEVEASGVESSSDTGGNVPSVNIEDLKSNLEDLALDDWEDYNDSD